MLEREQKTEGNCRNEQLDHISVSKQQKPTPAERDKMTSPYFMESMLSKESEFSFYLLLEDKASLKTITKCMLRNKET